MITSVDTVCVWFDAMHETICQPFEVYITKNTKRGIFHTIWYIEEKKKVNLRGIIVLNKDYIDQYNMVFTQSMLLKVHNRSIADKNNITIKVKKAWAIWKATTSYWELYDIEEEEQHHLSLILSATCYWRDSKRSSSMSNCKPLRQLSIFKGHTLKSMK